MSEMFYRAAGAILAPFRYAEREVKHMKENVKEDMQDLLASVIKIAVLAVTGLLFLLFISMTAAVALNNSIDSDYAGFAIVAGFYLIVAIVVFIMKQAGDHKHKIESEARKAAHG
jgi:hypothetical protein